MHLRVLVASLLVSSTASASPAMEERTSYRWQTIAIDAVGLSAVVVGDTVASDTLLGAGAITMLAATPLVHYTRGHMDRAKRSLAMRGGLALGGIVTAIVLNTGCGDGEAAPPEEIVDPDFLCEVEYIGFGMVAGLVVASVIDAAFMTDEQVVRATWAPQVTAGRDGVSAGAVFAW